MIGFKEIQNFLVERGVPLTDIGVNDFGVKRGDAFLLCDLLQEASLLILGGDVYCLKEDVIEITYDNWFFCQYEDENYEDYKKRAFTESKIFIEKYLPVRGDILFNIIFS